MSAENHVFWRLICSAWILNFSYLTMAQGVLLSADSGLIPLGGKNHIEIDVICNDIEIKNFAEAKIAWHVSETTAYLQSQSTLSLSIITPHSAAVTLKNPADIVIYLGVEPLAPTKCKALVYQPEDTHEALGKTIDAIFGVLSFSDTLDRHIGPFEMGAGIQTPGGWRLLDLTDTGLYRSLSDTLDQIVQSGLDSLAYPGAQLLVCHKNSVIHHRSYGFHTYEKIRPVESSHLYDLASLTKVVGGVPALMYLVDKGLISLDDNFCSLWPFLCKGNKSDLILRSALSHQAGLIPYIVFWHDLVRKNGNLKRGKIRDRQGRKHTVDINDSLFLHNRYYRKMYKQVRKSELLDSIEYLYSGLTFLLYPELVARKCHMRIDSFLYQQFYHPLGASNIMFRPHERVPLESIVPTEYDSLFRRQLVHGRVHDEASAMLGGLSTNAGLFSNALDLAKLAQMFLNRGTYAGRQFVSESIVEEFTMRHFDHQGNRRGLGFDKPLIEWNESGSYAAKSASQNSYGHSGFTGTFFWIDPQTEIIVIFLSNRVYPTRDNRKLYSLGIRPRLHQAVYDWLSNNN